MDVYVDELLREYDDYLSSNAHASLIGSKGKAWASTLLKELRKSKVRRSDIVCALGPSLLSYENSMDVWNLREQIAVAALEEGNFTLAETEIALLTTEFPESSRVGRIRGMLLEAKGDFTGAVTVYNDILKKDVANIAIMKRKVCVKKAQQDWRGVIDSINDIVKKFPSDIASWQEMGELYLSLSDNLAAVHCFEELVLLEPRNNNYHTRLAEVLYSADRFLLARKHYTISLSIQGPKFNKRALYGLIHTCHVLNAMYHNNTSSLVAAGGDSNSSNNNNSNNSSENKEVTEEHEKKVNHELLSWAQAQLETLVEHDNNVVGEQGPIALVEDMLLVK